MTTRFITAVRNPISPINGESRFFAVVCNFTRNPISPINGNMTQFQILEFNTFNELGNQILTTNRHFGWLVVK